MISSDDSGCFPGPEGPEQIGRSSASPETVRIDSISTEHDVVEVSPDGIRHKCVSLWAGCVQVNLGWAKGAVAWRRVSAPDRRKWWAVIGIGVALVGLALARPDALFALETLFDAVARLFSATGALFDIAD